MVDNVALKQYLEDETILLTNLKNKHADIYCQHCNDDQRRNS